MCSACFDTIQLKFFAQYFIIIIAVFQHIFAMAIKLIHYSARAFKLEQALDVFHMQHKLQSTPMAPLGIRDLKPRSFLIYGGTRCRVTNEAPFEYILLQILHEVGHTRQQRNTRKFCSYRYDVFQLKNYWCMASCINAHCWNFPPRNLIFLNALKFFEKLDFFSKHSRCVAVLEMKHQSALQSNC